ncbi:MAG: sn-glycerol-3-phosphate ABC transporter ATP-binding protein UgpC [Ancalomicrobiaceae bacterium]|nr:sn-glycerol-3-phosphate ABC transporter ATP-binding protein UgpC [Ancalomicrobiaceae bacterium]
MAAVTLKSVSKSYGLAKVVHDIEFAIADGEFVVLVGPSGCGKSTLLRMIAGLEPITSGEVVIDGEIINDVPPKYRDIAMVFQSYALYPHMTVAGNMGFALKLAGVPKAEAATRILKAADILGLGDLLDRYPRQLSGGQRQRVAMGRAIVRDPSVFLFDEPLSNLDAALRMQMRVEIAELHQRLGATMIYVTHDQTEAMTLADRIVVLNRGRVEQVATPMELYQQPRNLFVARFIGSPPLNLAETRVTANAVDRPRSTEIALKDGTRLTIGCGYDRLSVGQIVQLGIRPEALLPTDDGPLAGRVQLVEPLGGLTLLHVRLEGGDMFIVQLAGAAGWRVGSPIRLKAEASGVHLFDSAGQRIPEETDDVALLARRFGAVS